MKIVAALFAAVVLLAGCSGGSSDDEPTPAPAKASADVASQTQDRAAQQAADDKAGVEIEIGLFSDREHTPQGGRVEVKAGQKITLSITSDVDEELHVHSDPEHTFAVKPGKDQKFTFTVDTPGQVAVEAHHADVTLVQLVVRP